MSKMDNLRAMREARFDRTAATPPRRPAVARPAVAPTPEPGQPTREQPAGESSEELCGHRAISGRTCTRERGHAAKSHRYS